MRITLAPSEAAHLAALLRGLREWDATAVIRLQITERAVGFFALTPTDVLVFAAVPVLAVEGEDRDRVVSAGRLRDVLGDVTALGGAPRVMTIPEVVDGPRSLSDLPPRSGWRPAETALVKDLPTSGPRGWGPAPPAALHAGIRLGLLGHPDARVRSATATGWVRLETPAGQLFTKATWPDRTLRLV